MAFFKSPRLNQKSVQILINRGFANLLKKDALSSKGALVKLSRGLSKAMLIGANSVKSQMQMMNAVATGFMRKNIVSTVKVNYNSKIKVEGTIGTKAWYDILVHEGLGVHGGQRTIPAKYRPSKAQLAIIEPDAKTRKKYYKRSPKVPRPFLTLGIKAAKSEMKEEIFKSMRGILKEIGGKGAINIDLKSVLGGGRF